MKHVSVLLSLIFLVLVGAFALADAPQWIQTDERLVGENSTQYEDTLNRPVKTVWNTFLVGHDSAGSHTIAPSDIGAAAENHTHPLPTLGELGAAAENHTHPLPTLGELGAASANEISTLENVVNSLDMVGSTVFGVEHNADGTHNFIIPPTGGSWGLSSTSHGNPAISFTMSSFTMASGDMQIVVVARPAAYDVAEQFVGVTNDAYSCTRLAFGKNASNQLFVTVGTDLYDDDAETILCTEQTYVSSMSLTHDLRFHEYSVQMDTSGTLTFFLDGVPDSGSTMTGIMDLTDYESETFSLGAGFQGEIVSLKVGDSLTWNPAVSKGISQEGVLFPGALTLLPLNEGTGDTTAEFLSGVEMTIDSGWDWVQLPGPF